MWWIITLLLLPFLANAAPISPSVTTSDGSTWLGSTSSGVDKWLGIPFAQPPIGCPQMNLLAGALPGVLGVLAEEALDLVESIPLFQTIAGSNASEDCLTLNVIRPAGLSSTAGVPVMFWIFGGAFIFGGSSMYDRTSLVLRSVALGTPIIFVSVNYRINSFGFLPGAEVAADPTASVNAGLLDQRLGLDFGESAGAISVGFQMLAYDGKIDGLFRAAIMQSGSPTPVEGTSRGQHSFDVISNAVGCSKATDKIACLRAVAYEDLLDATNLLPGILSYNSLSLPFLPRTDGVVLTAQAQELLAAGKYATDIPIISGNQYDEGTILALGTLNVTSEAKLNMYLKDVFFPNTTAAQRAQILSLYPSDLTQGSPYDTGILNALTSQSKRINSLIGDFTFQATRRLFLSFTVKTQNTWSYASRVYQGVPLLGSFHFSDILAVFDLNPLQPAAEMQTRWIAFANTLDPNAQGYPYWPQYGSNKTLLEFSSLSESTLITDTYRSSAIAYWGTILSYLSL